MHTPTLNIHKDLIARCRKGDDKAQYELYQLYAKAMYNTAQRICGEREDAEDALQDAFISAFRSIKSYRGDASFGAWLKRIVVNKSLNLLKSKGREVVMMSDTVYDMETHQSENDRVDLSVDQIKLAVASLAPGFRTVLSLYLFEGYDHQEISSILNISESTSKTQYKRAKERLRLKLNDMKQYG